MDGKSLMINIDGNVMALLKASKYNLCLAKRVDGYPFTIVWYASADYIASNQFRWTPTYEIFFTLAFAPGAPVGSSSTAVSILPGQQVTVDADGNLSSTGSGDDPTVLTLVTMFPKPIFPALKQSSTNFSSQTAVTTNFMTPTPVLMGVTELTPMESIMVWFEQGLETGTMINQPSPDESVTRVSWTYPFVVDCSKADDLTITFDAQQHWSGPT